VIHGDTRRYEVGDAERFGGGTVDLNLRCREIDGIYSKIRRDTGRSAMGGPVEI
jgi:hypothetical protein